MTEKTLNRIAEMLSITILPGECDELEKILLDDDYVSREKYTLLIQSIRTMRVHQKEYFSSRNQTALIIAKEKEKLCDKLLWDIDGEILPSIHKQLNYDLFPE